MTPVRLEPAALRSRVKHSTTEPLRSLICKVLKIFQYEKYLEAYVLNSRFTCNQIPIMSFLGFKKAELGCKMSELHLYVVKRQNWVVIIRK